jgi:hypothetical protein
MDTNFWNEENLIAARQYVADALTGAGLVTGKVDNPVQHPEVVRYFDAYIQQGGQHIKKYETLDSFKAAFDEFVLSVGRVNTPVSDTLTIGMSITRNYGPVSIGFNMSADFVHDGSAASRAAAARWLDGAIKDMADTWERENISTASRGSSSAPQQSVASETLEGVLEHAFENEQHRFRFKAGRWEKYGVPVYKEAYELAGLGENTPMGRVGDYRATIEYGGDGKPKRAVALENLTAF